MVAYFYKDKDGKIKRINLHPAEFTAEDAKHKLYRSEKEARRATR